MAVAVLETGQEAQEFGGDQSDVRSLQRGLVLWKQLGLGGALDSGTIRQDSEPSEHAPSTENAPLIPSHPLLHLPPRVFLNIYSPRQEATDFS